MTPEEFEKVRDLILMDEEDKEEYARKKVDWPDELTFSSISLHLGTRVESQACLDELERLGAEVNLGILETARQLADVKAAAHQVAWDANDIYATAEKAKQNHVTFPADATENFYLVSMNDNLEFARIMEELNDLRRERRRRALEIVRAYR